MLENNDISEKLKHFYGSSQEYLARLERHEEKIFIQYIELIKQRISLGSSILDCGCGTGISSYLLAKEGFKVTGSDISPLFISVARKKYMNQPNLEFYVEDASKMSFKNQSFDAVCSFDLLEHVTDVKSVLCEMARVLKVGGVIIIFMPNHLDPLQHLMAFIRWKTRDMYKPWEAKSRLEAFYKFFKTTYLLISKAIGVNKKIYYLNPILSDTENFCGEDFDATWLTNWFDIENTLKELNFSIEYIRYPYLENRGIRIMKTLRLPQMLQYFYLKMRTHVVICGVIK